MTSIPERNLNPPKDDWVECPDCEGSGASKVPYEQDRYYCFRCRGDGRIPKAEERREIEAAQADKAHDEKRDREMMEKETSHDK